MFLLYKEDSGNPDEGYQLVSIHETEEEAHNAAAELALDDYRVEKVTLTGSAIVFEI